ncbi:hypothetical protein HGH93_11965 [Chitinophaga polysaccharea]|uniref:hypothetical protein n=1 Tax=Chitinophaga polysaccharea TaxID=1293035 RepID=UPI00145576AF|nr:hypothetical protein [Chitinophaga polysaccharea]NLR58822.1 hypothetical protein [Chitinophaga polysaccharea]
MARIIHLPQTPVRICTAAWQFARAVLWAEQPTSEPEEQRTVALIRQHLDYAVITESAFISFCERILLAREAQLTGQSGYLSQPSVWLHPNHQEGYTGTRLAYDQMLLKRAAVPGYREEYAVLSKYYYRYALYGRTCTIAACRRKLLRLKAYGLLTLLYRAVIYSNISH